MVKLTCSRSTQHKIVDFVLKCVFQGDFLTWWSPLYRLLHHSRPSVRRLDDSFRSRERRFLYIMHDLARPKAYLELSASDTQNLTY
jgi:hypothetical protein